MHDFNAITDTQGQADVVGAAAGRGAALENIADNFSTPRKYADFEAPSYREKFRLLDFLRVNSKRSRQRLCMAAAWSHEVKVVSSREGKYAYSGLQTCGSYTCPNCGPRIAAYRREEITMGLDSWTRGHGGKILFGTLTLRHDRSQSHVELADAVARCWWRATGGRGWISDRQSHGIKHTIRVIETKWNHANGWHVHVHFLLLVDAGRAQPDKLLKSMFGRWRMAALSLGLRAPLLDKGADLHEVSGEEAAAQLGDYFAKDASERGQKTAEAMGWEMSGNETKFRSSSFSPGELLVLAVAGAEGFLALFNEYELSMKKRRTIAWSKGARGDLGLDVELTDEEIAEKAELEAVLEHLTMPARVFRRIATTAGMRSELLDIVREFGAVAAVSWLATHGIDVYEDQPAEGVRYENPV